MDDKDDNSVRGEKIFYFTEILFPKAFRALTQSSEYQSQQ